MIRYLKLLAVAIVVLLVAYVGWSTYHRASLSQLQLDVVPNDATITINGKNMGGPATFYLQPGHYVVSIRRAGFTSQTKTYDLLLHGKQSYEIVLSTNSQEGIDWLNNNPDQQQKAQAYSDKLAAEGTAALQKKYPILSALPAFTNGTWRIDSGRSRQYPNDKTKVALYITAVNDAAKDEALTWMSDNNYPPSQYEIIYEIQGENGIDY